MLVEDAELAGIEAVEGANRRDMVVGDWAVGIVLGHGAPLYLPLSTSYLTLASIFRRKPDPVLLCMGLFSRF